MSTRKIQEFAKRIERRRDFLNNLVKTSSNEEMLREKAELVSLSWVAEYIKDTELVAAEHYTQWIKQLGKREW